RDRVRLAAGDEVGHHAGDVGDHRLTDVEAVVQARFGTGDDAVLPVGEGPPVGVVPLGAQPCGLLVPGHVDQAVAGRLGLVAPVAAGGQLGQPGLDPCQFRPGPG